MFPSPVMIAIQAKVEHDFNLKLVSLFPETTLVNANLVPNTLVLHDESDKEVFF